MSLMEREKHEELLNEALAEDTPIDRRTEILQELRADHVTAHETLNELEKTKADLEKDKQELVLSNSKMFRQLGIMGNEELEKEEEEKEFSETVTISELESNANLR